MGVSGDVVGRCRAGRGSVAVFICDPRLMNTFRSLSDSIELNFTIPESPEDLPKGEVLVVDDECLQLLERQHVLEGLKVMRVDEGNILSRVLELVGIRRVKALLVGVDLGTAVNYVILADNVLLEYGAVGSASDLMCSLLRVRDALRPEKVFIKVGVSPAGLHERFLDELLGLVGGCDYVLTLVDEHRTNVECPVSYVGRKAFKGMDFKACINIALREGLRITV
ncbi:MAG: hypothetical protein QXS42_02670 [Zestosphaera sp.]